MFQNDLFALEIMTTYLIFLICSLLVILMQPFHLFITFLWDFSSSDTLHTIRTDTYKPISKHTC